MKYEHLHLTTEDELTKHHELAKDIYTNAKDKGFWPEDRNMREARALIITELAESIEAHRKGNRALSETKFNCKLEEKEYKQKRFQLDWWKQVFEQEIKDTLEDELADAYIRCLDVLFGEAKMMGINTRAIPININSTGLPENFDFGDNFAANVYSIMKLDMSTELNTVAFAIRALADHMDIDLEWHIKQKHKYNKLRGHKHGKKY